MRYTIFKYQGQRLDKSIFKFTIKLLNAIIMFKQLSGPIRLICKQTKSIGVLGNNLPIAAGV